MKIRQSMLIALSALFIASSAPGNRVKDRLVEVVEQKETEIISEIKQEYPEGVNGYMINLDTLKDYTLDPNKKHLLSFEFLNSVYKGGDFKPHKDELYSKIKEARNHFKESKNKIIDQLEKVKACVAKYVDENDVDLITEENVYGCMKSDTSLAEWQFISDEQKKAFSAYDEMVDLLVITNYYKKLNNREKKELWESIDDGVVGKAQFEGFIELMGIYNKKNLEHIINVFE